MATDIETQCAIFSINNTKIYVQVVILSTQDNAKLLEQLKSGLKKTINQNKHQLKVSTEKGQPRLLKFLKNPKKIELY